MHHFTHTQLARISGDPRTNEEVDIMLTGKISQRGHVIQSNAAGVMVFLESKHVAFIPWTSILVLSFIERKV